jgi:asparagine synthase (glutamine-hydrolysing)
VGFGEDSYDEVEFARTMAREIGAHHHEEILTADAASQLAELVWHAEEPTADSSMVAVYHLARFARQHVTMVLSGDGADDIFAGYETYQAYYLHRAYARLPAWARHGLLRPLIDALPVSDVKVGWNEKLKRFAAAAELPWQDAHASWRVIFDSAARAKLMAGTHAADQKRDPLDIYRRSFDKTNALHPLNRMLYVDTRVYLPADMLVKIDRMTMAHGLETREPYLDYRLVEFAATVPPHLKLKRWTQKKYLLRAALRGRVPDRILDRRKQGFNVPKGRWMRNALQPFVADNLSERRIRDLGFLDPAAVDRVLRDHLSGVADNSHQIWCLLVLVLWHRQFIDGEAHAGS